MDDRRLWYRVAQIQDDADWVHVRDPVKRRSTVHITSYSGGIDDVTPVIVVVRKNDFTAGEFSSVLTVVSDAITLPYRMFSHIQTSYKGKPWPVGRVGEALLAQREHVTTSEDGVVVWLDDVTQAETGALEFPENYFVIFGESAFTDPRAYDLLASMGSGRCPMVDELRAWLELCPVVVSSWHSHPPVEFPMMVVWCRDSVLGSVIGAFESSDDLCLYEGDASIAQCLDSKHVW